jgi:hypothetical protein
MILQWPSSLLFLAGSAALVMFFGKRWFSRIFNVDTGFHAILFVSKIQYFVTARILKNGMVKRIVTSVQNLFLNSSPLLKLKRNQVVDADDRTYDFLLYTFRDEWAINRAIFYQEGSYVENMLYPVCRFTFITFDLVFGLEERYSINLSKPFNYYIVGNRLGSAFLLYLLKMQHGVTKNKDEMYVVEFYDPSVNLKYVTEEDEIVLELESYIVVNMKKEEKEKEKEKEEEDEDYFILPK